MPASDLTGSWFNDNLDSSYTSNPLRYLTDRSQDFPTVEDFGAAGNGTTVDFTAIQNALDWSAKYGRPVFATRFYNLGEFSTGTPLKPKSNTRFIASPSALFIRSNIDADPGAGSYLVKSVDGASDIVFEGGIWGYRFGNSPSAGNFSFHAPDFATSNVSVAPDTVNPGYLILTMTGLSFSQFNNYIKAVSLAGDPSSILNNRVFVLGPAVIQGSGNQIRVVGTNVTASGTSMTASAVPPAGGGFAIDCPRGVLKNITLVNTRGIAFFLSGDDLEISGCSAYNSPFDGGAVLGTTTVQDLGQQTYILSVAMIASSSIPARLLA